MLMKFIHSGQAFDMFISCFMGKLKVEMFSVNLSTISAQLAEDMFNLVVMWRDIYDSYEHKTAKFIHNSACKMYMMTLP